MRWFTLTAKSICCTTSESYGASSFGRVAPFAVTAAIATSTRDLPGLDTSDLAEIAAFISAIVIGDVHSGVGGPAMAAMATLLTGSEAAFSSLPRSWRVNFLASFLDLCQVGSKYGSVSAGCSYLSCSSADLSGGQYSSGSGPRRFPLPFRFLKMSPAQPSLASCHSLGHIGGRSPLEDLGRAGTGGGGMSAEYDGNPGSLTGRGDESGDVSQETILNFCLSAWSPIQRFRGSFLASSSCGVKCAGFEPVEDAGVEFPAEAGSGA